MKRIKVKYFVKRNRSGNVVGTTEKSMEITVLDTVYHQLRHAYAHPEECKPLLTLTEALRAIAKIQGYEFVSVMEIEDVGPYEYD